MSHKYYKMLDNMHSPNQSVFKESKQNIYEAACHSKQKIDSYCYWVNLTKVQNYTFSFSQLLPLASILNQQDHHCNIAKLQGTDMPSMFCTIIIDSHPSIGTSMAQLHP